jgi:hypothetical protein
MIYEQPFGLDIMASCVLDSPQTSSRRSLLTKSGLICSRETMFYFYTQMLTGILGHIRTDVNDK